MENPKNIVEVVEVERPGLSIGPKTTEAEVTQCRYKNTRVSVTILKRQGQSVEHILSFDVTDPIFEKEILSEHIAYEEEDDQEEDIGVEEEATLEFQPYDDDPEGPNLNVEEETEVINIGIAEEVKEVRISARLTP